MTSPRGESLTGTSKLSTVHSDSPQRLLFIFGTRPEAIKLAPLVAEFRKPEHRGLHAIVCVTGQHREMLGQVLTAFDIEPDFNLDVMVPGQTLNGLSARLLASIAPVLEEVKPSMAVVQGDTTSTLCGALASFHSRVPVAHVEAGLRTSDNLSPFPEEMNRVLTDKLSTLYFAATEWAADNLRREGINPEQVWTTGNTGIDAVISTRDALVRGDLPGVCLPFDETKRLIVVTAHRRENFGSGIVEICEAVSALAARGDVQIVWPVHPNPEIEGVVGQRLAQKPNVLLIGPLDYLPFVDLMRRCYFLLTDSGGVQEEAPSLGKPVLVLRGKTERPEGVKVGTVKLVGSNCEAIIGEAFRLLDDPSEYRRMSRLHNPYGDGNASRRIAGHIARYLAATRACSVPG
ncbi:MAG: non-hydrolyzing UDP-N-acetylglucosamine 2-epimerase [Bryobacteraceae bacterium]